MVCLQRVICKATGNLTQSYNCRQGREVAERMKEEGREALLQRQAHQLGKQREGAAAAAGGAATEEESVQRANSSSAGCASASETDRSSREEAEQLALAFASAPPVHQSRQPAAGAGGVDDEGTTRAHQRNAWEVRRLLAARDCKGIRGQTERWLAALRLPHQGPLMTSADAVQRARAELVVRVHPDKCAPGDAKLAAEAFAFLQQACTGLLL